MANYSNDLLQSLKKFYEIHLVFITQYKAEERPKILDDFVHVSVDQFKASYSTYDRILYHFGNSSFHLSYFDLLQICPGVVVLHDFYLDGVVSMLPDGFERVYDAHGLVGVCSTFLGLTKQPVYPCNLEVIDLAQGIIVHSEFARSLLQNWYGKRVYEESAVVPFPCPSAIACTAGSQSKKLESSKSIVCSFGYLGPSKLNHSLFEAWAESVSDYSVLVFVGAEGEKEYCDVLKEKIHSSGYSEKVFYWMGFRKGLFNWMEKATLSVQLRTNSRGKLLLSI